MKSYGLFILIAFVVVSAALVVLLFYLRELFGHWMRSRRVNYFSLQRSLRRTAGDAWQSAACERADSTKRAVTGPAVTGPAVTGAPREATESREDVQAAAMNLAAGGLAQAPYNVPTA